MIATILYSSPTFQAVNYNERKVAKGDATLLCVENFGYLDTVKEYCATHLQQYLVEYSKRNERIEKPQLHVSFSCKGNEMTNEELVSFARQWLSEMGYNNEKQPLLIYAHKDTNNNHIHVITSRVDPQGNKVNHHHERVRSKTFVDKTLGVDTKRKLKDAIANSLSYRYESKSGWKAVLEAQGYAVQEDKDVLKIVCNGAYINTLSLTEVESRVSSRYAEKKRIQQLKALLLKYRDLSTCKEELKEVMKRKFGVDLVFFGGKDTPRGYFVVDHQKKSVYKGSSVLKIAQLLDFESKEEKLQRTDTLIDALLEKYPTLTEKELDLVLRKYYAAKYEAGVISFKGGEKAIQSYMREALHNNIKAAKRQQLGSRREHYNTNSSSANREFEVGGGYDSFDDARKLKR